MFTMLEARIVLIAFLAFNSAIGVTYGSYGPLLTSIQQQFNASRGLASMGISMCLISVALASPIVGIALKRWRVRSVLITGTLLSMVGYLLLTQVSSIWELLAIYGLLIGPGQAASAVIPNSTLIGRWFVQGRGKALGIMNIPLATMLVPLLASYVLVTFGFRAVFLTNAAIYALLLPFLFLIIETPESIGRKPRGAEISAAGANDSGSELTTMDILRRRDFWLLSIGVSIAYSASIIVVVQLVPLLMGHGLDLKSASRILSIYGVSLAVGTVLYGWLSDRVGGNTAYMICAFMIVPPLLAFIFVPPAAWAYTLLAVVAALPIGAVGTLHATAASELFGQRSFSHMMGLSYLVTLPATTVSAPLAGYAYDLTGSYNPALLGTAIMIFAAGIMFWMTAQRYRDVSRVVLSQA